MAKRKLTVGLVFDDSLDRPDGVQQYVQRIAEWLIAQGHEVYFLVGDTVRTDLKNIMPLSRNMQVKFNGNTMSMPLPTSKALLKKVLAEQHFDVLHVQVPYSPFMAGRLMKLAEPTTAVVGTFHILPYSGFVVFANRLLTLMNKASGKRFDKMIAVSPPAKAFAETVCGYNCEIVPNPVRVADFPAANSPANTARPRIVFLGRLVERKGAGQLLRAVNHLKKAGLYEGEFEVVIGGKGELLDPLKDFVRTHGLQTTVSFRGFVPEGDKAELLASADLAVFPSISGESFGISLLEAMAAARGPVLAGNNPGYASVMHGLADRLFDPLDIPAFAEALASWLSDTSRRLRAAEEQRAYVQQYDIAVVGAQVEAVYAAALQSRPHS